jgi:hypothetical protein
MLVSLARSYERPKAMLQYKMQGMAIRDLSVLFIVALSRPFNDVLKIILNQINWLPRS